MTWPYERHSGPGAELTNGKPSGYISQLWIILRLNEPLDNAAANITEDSRLFA